MIDFDWDYYGVDFCWMGKVFLLNIILVVGVVLDCMVEDWKGYNNYNE